MEHRAGLAVHLPRTHHVTTKGLADGLMAQARPLAALPAKYLMASRKYPPRSACRGPAKPQCAPGSIATVSSSLRTTLTSAPEAPRIFATL